MPIFYSPNKSGKGVSKNEPEKKPFFKFFELVGRKFWKLVQLNLLYILMCVPIVTFGPATAALTYVMRKFTLEQPIFVFSEFFSAFKKNFKQSFAVGLIDVVFTYFIVQAAIFFFDAGDNAMLSMTMASAAIFTTLNLYIYPQIVSLNLKLPAIFKNAALLGVVGLKRNAVTLVSFAAIISLFFFTAPFSLIFILFFPLAFMSFLAVFNAYPVIRKFVIDPYYEAKGEKNPELPDYESKENIFTDLGGREQSVNRKVNKKNVKTGGKVIK